MNDTIVSKIRKLIAEAKTRHALDLLQGYYEKSKSEDKTNKIILVKSNFHKNEKDRFSGRITEEEYGKNLVRINEFVLIQVQEDFNSSKGFYEPSRIFLSYEEIHLKMRSEYSSDKLRFETVFNPLYDNILIIHKDYQKMFEKVLRLLPDKLGDGKIIANKYNENGDFEKMLDITDNEEEYLRSIDLAKKILRKERIENDNIRLQSRTFAQRILIESVGEKEKAFCWSILNYFLSATPPFTDKDFLNQKIEQIIQSGADPCIDTPSYLVSIDVFESSDSSVISEEIRSILEKLNRNFVDICTKFLELKLSLI